MSPLAADELAMDLATLRPSALRAKYVTEASSHRNMKRRTQTGFELHPAWETFAAFLRDMGCKPDPSFSLDRIDPTNRLYGPGLCRWASPTQQTVNRRNTIWINWEGQARTLSDFTRIIEAPYEKVYYRWSRGMALPDIVKSLERRSQGYCPLRYADDPHGLAAWYGNFDRWRRSTRKDRREFAIPEVYDLVAISRAYPAARGRMEARGYFDQTNSAEYLAFLAQDPIARMVRDGWNWAEHAIAAIEEDHPEVAKSIIGNRYRGNMLIFAERWDWFLKREDGEQRPESSYEDGQY
jgi:hypothetical protein